ncbi:type VI secretion system protein TssA [Acidicapsa dinghuensis]|uniref:Type VI secretion system protein TssA n=1 Tax=Acidicapsa dinghuensis TaxID=2218256 RepID=A0ABW1EHR8_9BACT|nr:type VI secretion system protein TssA [Acidicapsa dinghuensis]
MPLREDILTPIPGDNPSGIDLRYDNKLLVHDKIKEARRQDDDLAQGEWQAERKIANFPLVVKLAQETLATSSKDLQLAAWLTEALLQTEKFPGLHQGLDLTFKLLNDFWDTIYPVLEEDDKELRARPLNWIGTQLDLPIRNAPITNAGYSWLIYKDSRQIGYDEVQRPDKDKKAREALIAGGRVSADIFDKSFNETPKAFYAQTEKEIDASLAIVVEMETYCDERLEDDSPSFGKLKTALTEVRQTIHQLLEKKREKEPDPVEEVPIEASAEGAEGAPVEGQEGAATTTTSFAVSMTAEPADRRQAVGSILAAAQFLRKREPLSPAPYLLLRGLRWGELRAAGPLAGNNILEAPTTELRQQIKRLAIAKRWADLLEAGEQAMAHPGSRAWLDLQRLSVAACNALGPDYEPIAKAIQSELRALLNDLPDLLDATLLDDTPAANPETKAWLQGLSEPIVHPASEDAETPAAAPAPINGIPTWLKSATDAYSLAKDALAAGQEEKAFAIMRAEIARQRSGRRRFRRTMQMVELAVTAGKDALAQPLLEDISAMIENHKLDAWEDPEQVASDLIKLMRHSKKIQGNAGDKQKLFERICRLDPVQALNVG